MTEEVTLETIIRFLGESAVPIPYLDEYPFFITESCNRPFIVISSQDLERLEKSVGVNV